MTSFKSMKYGDYVNILGTTTNQKYSNVQGFLSCIGFSDQRVFFQKVPDQAIAQAMKQTFSLLKDKGITWFFL